MNFGRNSSESALNGQKRRRDSCRSSWKNPWAIFLLTTKWTIVTFLRVTPDGIFGRYTILTTSEIGGIIIRYQQISVGNPEIVSKKLIYVETLECSRISWHEIWKKNPLNIPYIITGRILMRPWEYTRRNLWTNQ